MRRGWLLLLSLSALAAVGLFASAETPKVGDLPLTVGANGHNFTVAPGFDVQLAAGPPLVKRPITAAFDYKGHLYVAESSGSNEPVAAQLEKKPHKILRLTDRDGDGQFDYSTVFADNMMFPEGTMFFDGSLYVAAPPSIWKLTDTDGDGVADKREEWFKGKTLTGCANDLHGPYLGPDGWIYWCKGAFAKQEYTLPGGKPFTTRASHIFRARPDGTGMEPVMTGGMDNPVDVVFMPNGDRIFTTTFLQHPGGGRRDGLIHAVYGGLYGKDHDPIYEHKWTGPELMPVLSHLGPAAPCGLHRLETATWGPEFRDNLFACQFNLRKVSRHVLTPDGATYKSADSDFLVSDNFDFHPTDVIESPDGSLLIVDTGGWYKLCCPTSQLAKPDVLGGIYRVRKKTLAVEGRREKDRREHEAQLWRWSMKGEERQENLEALLAKDERFVQIALHMISLNRDKFACPQVLTTLRRTTDPMTRRAAVEAVGRIGNADAVADLFALLRQPVDRATEHSIIYALIELNHPEAVKARLPSDSPAVRRVACIALDQLGSPLLDAETVVADLDAADPATKAAAWWIVGRHPEWGEQLVQHWADRPVPATDLAKLAKSPAVQTFIAERGAFDAMALAGVREVPAAWTGAIAAALASEDEKVLRSVLMAIRRLPPIKGLPREPLFAIANDTSLPIDLRLMALAATPGSRHLDQTIRESISHADADRPAAVRSLAIEVLSKSDLTKPQLLMLVESLPKVGPMDMDKLLEVFTRTNDEAVGVALVAKLKVSPGRSALRPDGVKQRIAKYNAVVQKEAESLYELLNADLAKQREKLESMMGLLADGDIRRGQAVFNGTKAACIGCHAVGYVGGKVGPDLTRIGGVRTERDLLEAILFPSASFVRSYEPVSVETKAGKVFNGVLRLDAADEVVLAVDATNEVRIPRAEIESMEPGKLSVMPAGLDQQLTPRELADLVTFLKACK